MTNKSKWTVVVLVMFIFLSSCQKDEIINSYTQNYTVYKDDWKIGRDDSGEYRYYEFYEPNLTRYIYDNGSMQAFMLVEDDNITPLPFDDFWIDGDYRWTEQVTCEFRPGYITFILKYNDHANQLPYYDYTFRVRFLW